MAYHHISGFGTNILSATFKMMIASFPILLLFLSFVSSAATAQGDKNAVKFEALYFEDVGGRTTFSDLVKPEVQEKFRSPGENGLSFGWVDNPYWFKVDIEPDEERSVVLLEVPWPLLDKLDIYLLDDSKRLVKTHHLGDHKPFTERPIFDSHFVVPIDFTVHPVRTIYFNVSTTSSLQLPLDFWSQHEYLEHRSIYYTVQGIFYGLLLVMIFYNLFIYFSTKRVAYLHYVCFAASFGLLQAGLKGAGFQFRWPTMPFLNDYAVATGGGLSLLFLTLFARSFLQLEETPVLKKINDYMLGVAVLFIAASLLLDYRTVITPLTLFVLAAAFTVIAKAVYRYRQGFHEARFYLLAWIAMALGACTYLFKQLGLLPVNLLTENAMQIGSAVEVLLLSFALADRLNTLRVGLESANHKLEKEVKERTRELVNTLDKLGKANTKLAVMSTTDGLTGLRNRYYFDIELEKEIERSRRARSTLSLLLIDIDRFKRINDEWGHLSGDSALKFAGGLLSHVCKRQTDTICRYGGEEFAVIVPGADTKKATELAEIIRMEFENSEFFVGDKRLPITVSVGVCNTVAVENSDADLLIRAADIALYNAKEDGRNCVHLFSGKLTERGTGSIKDTLRVVAAA